MTLVGQKCPHVVQMLKTEVESRLRNPGNSEQSLDLVILTFFFLWSYQRQTFYLHIAKSLILHKRNVIVM